MEDRIVHRQFRDGTFIADADCPNEEVAFSISNFQSENIVLDYKEIMDYAKFMQEVGIALGLMKEEKSK